MVEKVETNLICCKLFLAERFLTRTRSCCCFFCEHFSLSRRQIKWFCGDFLFLLFSSPIESMINASRHEQSFRTCFDESFRFFSVPLMNNFRHETRVHLFSAPHFSHLISFWVFCWHTTALFWCTGLLNVIYDHFKLFQLGRMWRTFLPFRGASSTLTTLQLCLHEREEPWQQITASCLLSRSLIVCSCGRATSTHNNLFTWLYWDEWGRN